MRYSAADVFLTFAVTLSIFALDALARRRDGSDAIWGALSGGALALSFGFKGLAGLVMPVGGVALGLLIDRVRPVRVWRRGLIALGVLILLLLPWHWAMTEALGAELWRGL